jgi:PAS domain S-box-containing protein
MKDEISAAGYPDQAGARQADAGDKIYGADSEPAGRLAEGLRAVFSAVTPEERIMAALRMLSQETGIPTVFCGDCPEDESVCLLLYGWHKGAASAVQGLEIRFRNEALSGYEPLSIYDMERLGFPLEGDFRKKFPAPFMAVAPFKSQVPGSRGMILLMLPALEELSGPTAQLAVLVARLVAGELGTIQVLDELKEIEEKFDNLVERANDGIVIVQKQKIVYANRNILDTLGYAAAELVSRPFGEFVAESERARMIDIYTRRMRGEEVPSIYEATLIRKDGESLPVEINAGVIHFQGQPANLAIVRDISLRKSMEEELLKSKKLESVGILAGGIAHDFNNLLTAIMGNISIVLMNSEKQDREQRLLREAQVVVMRAKNLTQQLLAFAKTESAEKRIMPLKSLLVSTVEFALSGSGIGIKFHISKDLWPSCIDDVQIGQAIHNLIMNSRDQMEQGGEIHVQAENIVLDKENKHALPAGSYVQIRLKDHGPGISPHHREHVFDPYFSTKEATAERGKGLGLAICHSIIKDHKGSITVESELEVGTTFTILLPAHVAEPDEGNEKEEGVEAVFGEKRILVMDDEDMILAVAERMLARLGYHVISCRHGEAAVRLWKEAMRTGREFDALILDITVRGGMGGLDTLAELKRLDPGCRAIASSGYSDAAAIQEHLAAGFSGVLTKPYTLQKLEEVLQQVLNQ